MGVPSARTDLSAVAASNSPAGSDTVAAGTGPDDYLRAHASLIRQNYDDLAAKAPLANPTFTGHITTEGVTATGATGTGKFVFDASPTITGHPTIEGVTATGATGTGKMVFDASPTLTGTPAAPTAAADTNTTQLATTAYVVGQAYAKLASPTFTGTVALPASGFSGTVEHNNNLVTEVKTLSFNGIVDDGDSGTSKTINFGAGQYHKISMTGNCEMTFTAPAGPCMVHIEITQSSGSHTYTTVPALKWPGVVPTADKALSTAAGARDLLILRYNGTDYVANLIKAIA